MLESMAISLEQESLSVRLFRFIEKFSVNGKRLQSETGKDTKNPSVFLNEVVMKALFM